VRGYELRGIVRPGSEREFNDVHVLAIALVCRVSPRMQERLKADAGRNPPLCGSRQGYWAAWREALAITWELGMRGALGGRQFGAAEVFVDLEQFGFVVAQVVVDLGADRLMPALARRSPRATRSPPPCSPPGGFPSALHLFRSGDGYRRTGYEFKLAMRSRKSRGNTK